MPGPFQPLFVPDHEAYLARRRELEQEIAERVKARGTGYTMEDLNYIADEAGKVTYSTEFSKICTAAIRGDWEPAKERCRREREEKGENVARSLMRSYQKAVRDKLRMINDR